MGLDIQEKTKRFKYNSNLIIIGGIVAGFVGIICFKDLDNALLFCGIVGIYLTSIAIYKVIYERM
jgi:hypothetical protein